VTLSEPGVADLFIISLFLLLLMVFFLVHEGTVPWSTQVSVGGDQVGPGFMALISS
jgi:hypothetical protein